MPKKIILVSSGQPSLNPRLVKEADALTDAGYDVTVFYAYWNHWGTEYDKSLLASSKWKAVLVGGSPQKQRLSYLVSRAMHKIARKINPAYFIPVAISRVGYSLIREVKKHKADLYIGHNLGALPAVVMAAEKHQKPCGFDAEDLHRYETTDDINNDDFVRRSLVENKYIPQLNYFTASSPQIAERYASLFPGLKPVVLLNTFKKITFDVRAPDRPLKLFWFSQTIGAGRGIEDIIQALSLLKKDDFELHLLGHRPTYSEHFITGLLSTNIDIKFHDPIMPDQVTAFAAQFDIGLALEQKTPLNRDLCITNKIFTYMQAGLAIIASETTAQGDFMRRNPAIGATYQAGDIKTLAGLISNYTQHPDELMACKKTSLKLAHEQYNWETESRKFLKLIKEIL